jgi:hypothetical protein
VFDDSGMMALPGLPTSNLIVNIVCGYERLPSSKPPVEYQHATLLTIVIDNIPMVYPFTMTQMGPVAYGTAYEATLRALEQNPVLQRQQNNNNSYIYTIRGDAFRGKYLLYIILFILVYVI